MRKTTCKIFSDASYDHLTGKCGYGVAIVMKDLCILKYGSINKVKSSCEAEILAAKKGLDYLNTKEFRMLCRPVRKVVLLSDNYCVKAFDEDSKTAEKWGRSPNKDKQRLKKVVDQMRKDSSKYDRGYEAFHITAHQDMGNLPEHEKNLYNRQLEYKFNQWCDQSARKNLRYGLRGKKIIKTAGIPDPEQYSVEVPENAKIEWQNRKSLAQNLQ